MSRPLALLGFALALATVAHAAGPTLSFNPFADAIEGEEARYRFRLSGAGAVGGPAGDAWLVTMRVARVGPDAVTVRQTDDEGGGAPIETEAARGEDVRDALALLRVVYPDLLPGGAAEVEPEAIEVGGVRHDAAEKVTYAATADVEGLRTTERVAAWFARDVPVAGLVKLVVIVTVQPAGEPAGAATETRIEAERVPS